jgi:hypothetical protein
MWFYNQAFKFKILRLYLTYKTTKNTLMVDLEKMKWNKKSCYTIQGKA